MRVLILSWLIFSSSLWADAYRLQLARSLAAEGKYTDAIKEYRLHLESSPEDAAVYEEIGRMYLAQKQYKQALIHFRLSFQYDAERFSAQQGLALAYELGGESSRAILEWRKLATISPNATHREESEQHIQDILKGLKKKQVDLEERAKSIDTIKSVRESRAKDSKVPFYMRSQNNDITDTSLLRELGVKKKELNDIKVAQPTVIPNIENKGIKEISKSTKSKLVAGKDNPEKSTPPAYRDPLYIKALDLKNKGKSSEALDAFRNVLNKYPNHAGAYFHAGEIRFKNSDYEMAQYNLERGLEDPENGIKAHFYLGKIYEIQKDRKNAQKHFNIYVQRVDEGKLRDEAVAYLTKAGVAVPIPPPKPIPATVAWKIVRGKKIGFGWRLFVADSNRASARELAQAVGSYQKGFAESAIDDLREIAQNYPGDLVGQLAQLNIAMMYGRLGLYDESIHKVDGLSWPEEEPWMSQVLWIKALGYRHLKKYPEVLPLLNRVEVSDRIGPTAEEKAQLMAEVYVKLGHTKEAILAYRDLRLLQQADSSRLRTDLLVGKFLLSQKQDLEAQKYYERAITGCQGKIYSFCPDAYIQLADMQMKKRELDAARKNYSSMVEKYKDHTESAWALYQIGNIYQLEKNPKLALEHFKRVREEYPSSYWATQAKWKEEDATWRQEYGEVYQ